MKNIFMNGNIKLLKGEIPKDAPKIYEVDNPEQGQIGSEGDETKYVYIKDSWVHIDTELPNNSQISDANFKVSDGGRLADDKAEDNPKNNKTDDLVVDDPLHKEPHFSRIHFYPISVIDLVIVLFTGSALLVSLLFGKVEISATLAGGLIGYLSKTATATSTIYPNSQVKKN